MSERDNMFDNCCSEPLESSCCAPSDAEPQKKSCCNPSSETTEFTKVSSEYGKKEKIDYIKSRLSNKFRSNNSVKSGLYAYGNPDKNSPVLISCNYKMSFDILRRDIFGLDAWIVVIDTKGINVWCAAGKGIFGTDEIVERISSVKLKKYVNHRKIIVPQLGASGVEFHKVKKMSGFSVLFGPVDSKDIVKYINDNYRANRQMRKKTFPMFERLVLTPMEVNFFIKESWIYVLFILIIAGLQPSGIIFKDSLVTGLPFIISGLISLFMGSILTPLFLPFIPFRSFAMKGWLFGILGIVAYLNLSLNPVLDNLLIQISLYITAPVISSFLTLNFTGCTTFTNPTGVEKEMRISIPLYIIGIAISAICIIIFKLQEWRMI